MKCIIFAAGRGTRISRYLQGNPKCTVDIGNGKPLIRYTVETLNNEGIDDITIILGYNQNKIREVLKDKNVKFCYNPFFDVTNSIASAYFALDELNKFDDTLLMNGDVYMEENYYKDIINEKKDVTLFADDRRIEEADYKLKYTKGILLDNGKELSVENTTGEYIGIAKLSKDFMPKFTKRLEEMINTQQHSVWWENVLYSMKGERNIYVTTINDKFWAEVDYVEDYERIIAFVKGKQAYI